MEFTPKTLAGFFDADGCNLLPKYMEFRLAQSHEVGYELLTGVDAYLETDAKLNYYAPFDAYTMTWRGDNAWKFFNIVIKDNCVIKCGKTYLSDRINAEWIGGFFAGDGCIWEYDGIPHLKITQKDKRVLDDIRIYFEMGSVCRDNTGWKWTVAADNARKFASQCGKFCLHKSARVLSIL